MWTCARRQEYVRVKTNRIFEIPPRTFLNVSGVSYTFYNVIYNDKIVHTLVRRLLGTYFPHRWQGRVC